MLYIQSIVVYTLLALLMCLGAYYSKRDVPMAKLWGWMPIVLFTLVFTGRSTTLLQSGSDELRSLFICAMRGAMLVKV